VENTKVTTTKRLETMSTEQRKSHPVFNGKYEIMKSLGEGNTSKVYLGKTVNAESD